MMLRLKQSENNSVAARKASEYAKAADFCAIFRDDMEGLYGLALLLTGNHPSAERAFASALEEARRANGVFREWARSWSRRAVIKNAIGLLRPSRSAGETPAVEAGLATQFHPAARPLFQLSTFERFVFVLSVLEGYSERETASLLACGRSDVVKARARALASLGEAAVGTVPPLHALAGHAQVPNLRFA